MQSSLPGIISFLFSISGSSTDTCDRQKETARSRWWNRSPSEQSPPSQPSPLSQPSPPSPNLHLLHHLNLLHLLNLLHPSTFSTFYTSSTSATFSNSSTSATFSTTSTFFLSLLRTHHVQRCVVDVLQEDPVALGHSLCQAPRLPHKLPGNVGAAVHPQQHL